VLRVAEILDQAGFACLEVSGGGVFDATVRRKVESPWERIRAIKARVSTPLGIALRGRFLVGSRPVSGDIVGRFVSCAAENGIGVFRLHDPLNDVSNLREAGAAIRSDPITGVLVLRRVKPAARGEQGELVVRRGLAGLDVRARLERPDGRSSRTVRRSS
jgi:pyruvate/oxaloacetate carboxyltransferase